jgi:hypothetical protein
MGWLAENWYIAWALFCAAVIAVATLHFRRNPEGSGARAFFRIFPRRSSAYDGFKELTPRALVLWIAGLVIVVLAILFVPGFA